MAHRKKPIGVFDSGIGGLTVLKELQRLLPQEHFVYFADTANIPYGEKTPAQVMDCTRNILTWMQKEIGAKLVVAACHTSSATALDSVCPEFPMPVVGAIQPMVEAVLKGRPDRRIGIIATPTSVNSRVHETILIQSGFKGIMRSISCPKFVPIIESGRLSSPELFRSAGEYLSIFKEMGLNTAIYGCTHYPWIADMVQRILPSGVEFIDPAEPIAAKAAQWLYKGKMLNTSTHKMEADFYCSGSPDRFAAQLNLFMSIPNPQVTFVNFGDVGASSRKIAINQ